MEDIKNSDIVSRAVSEMTENGTKFPRAVFVDKLINLGLTESTEWIEYAKRVVLNPENEVGRTLILMRATPEMQRSPAILVARGRGGELSESYVQPHTENANCIYEKLSLLEGKANLIKLDMQGNLLESIPLDEKLVDIKPGEVHTVLFESPLVVLFEQKEVQPGLDKVFIASSVPEGDLKVPKLLKEWRAFADKASTV